MPTQPEADAGAALVYERVLPAVPTAVGSIRRELDAALARIEVPPLRRHDVALVLTEAAANVVVHAYGDVPTPGPLYALAAMTGPNLRLDVFDRGRGMTPGSESPGLGVGLALMARLSDGLDITPAEGGGLKVTAIFRGVTPVPALPDPPAERSRSERARDYVAALLGTSAALQQQTRTLTAEADAALVYSQEMRRARLVAPP